MGSIPPVASSPIVLVLILSDLGVLSVPEIRSNKCEVTQVRTLVFDHTKTRASKLRDRGHPHLKITVS